MIAKRLLSRVILPCILLISGQTVLAQKTISGKVTDAKDGSPIVGATVQPKGGTSGTSTGTDGSYTLSVGNDVTAIIVSYVGFGTIEVSISGKTAVDVTLTSTGLNLNEVVVVGYGTARRRDVTGATQSVRPKDFNKGVIISPDQAIQGKAAGVMVISNSGQPGGATTVRIRGTSSIRSGNSPLYVIDGVPLSGSSARPNPIATGIGATPNTNPINFVNPADIASVEILKDASATAIYGSRGANGVILITTKKGLSSGTNVEANIGVGSSSILKQLEVLNAAEYKTALSKYAITAGDFGGNVNAMDAILRTAFTQNYYAGIGSGNENARYRVSIGYLDQQGIVKESGIKKITASFNSSFKLLPNKRLSVDFNVITAQVREQLAPISNDAGFTGSLIGQALQWNPTHPLHKPDGSIWVNNQLGATTVNPLAMLEAYDARTQENVILANISPSYKFTDNFEYKLQYSFTRRDGNALGEIKRWINIQDVENRGVAAVINGDETVNQVTNTLSYNKEFSPAFNLNAVVGHEYLKFDGKFSGMGGSDFTDAGSNHYYDYMQYSSQGSRFVFAAPRIVDELQSFFGRAIMNFYDKFLVTATIRSDGSSRFGENNKYGYFPSIAAAWNISNEDFFKSLSWVSNLKLRVGWGKTGNQEFPGGAALDRYLYAQQSIVQANFGNPDLKWETSTTTNAGFDYSLFDGRLFGSFDYFYKKTTDVLFEQDVVQPGPAGPKIWVNLPGNVVNSGVEIVINAGIIQKKDLSWTLGTNLSFLDNSFEGIEGYYETGGLHGQGISGARAQRLVSGQPLNVYYLAVFQGIDKTTGQALYQGGDPASNKFYVGSPNPTALVGITTELAYKKFTLTVAGNGTYGHYIYNNTANTVLPIGNLGTRNIAKALVETDIKEDASNPITPSTRYLEKGNYFKLANATLSYNVGKLSNTFRNLNISFTAQNLFIITNFTGFDPEVNTDKSVGGIPSLGIEYTPYPTSRTFLLGVSLQL